MAKADTGLVALTELVEKVIDNRGRSCPTAEFGIPLIATNCVTNDTLYPVKERVRFVSEDTYKTWFKGHPIPGDVLFVNKGTPGRVNLVPDVVDFCIAQDMVALRPDSNKINPLYFFAAMRSEPVQQLIRDLSVGSTIPHLKKGDFGQLKIPVVDMPLQEFIGNSYFKLSKKIEVNKQIASTLEQMAQTIFKSWFVDFDPVHAKARGEHPAGMDAETAALFPDSFEDSELGPIPSGWMCSTLGDLVQPKKGKTITKATTREGDVPVVAGGLGPAYFHDTSNVNPPVVTISASGTAGFVRLYTQPIWASDCTYISREQSDIVLFWLQFLKFNQSRIYDMQQGGAQPHIYASDLMRLQISVPAEVSLLTRFEALIQPMFEAIGVNARENETLGKLRDSALPRLISGELEIPAELLEA